MYDTVVLFTAKYKFTFLRLNVPLGEFVNHEVDGFGYFYCEGVNGKTTEESSGLRSTSMLKYS